MLEDIKERRATQQTVIKNNNIEELPYFFSIPDTLLHNL